MKGEIMFEHVVIENGCTIGEGTVIEPFSIVKAGTYIGDNCIIGAHCRIAPNCVIGSGCDIRSGSLLGANTVLEENVFLGAAVICTSPSFHNPKKTAHTVIENSVRIGAGTIKLPGIHISKGVRVGALSLVNRPLVSPGMYFGIPARYQDNPSDYIQTCVPTDGMTDNQLLSVIRDEMNHGRRLVAIKEANFIFDNRL